MTAVDRRAATAPATTRRRRSRRSRRSTLTTASGIGLGVTMLWFSLLVLLPLCAVVVSASKGGWAAFWHTVTNPADRGGDPAHRR